MKLQNAMIIVLLIVILFASLSISWDVNKSKKYEVLTGNIKVRVDNYSYHTSYYTEYLEIHPTYIKFWDNESKEYVYTGKFYIIYQQ